MKNKILLTLVLLIPSLCFGAQTWKVVFDDSKTDQKIRFYKFGVKTPTVLHPHPTVLHQFVFLKTNHSHFLENEQTKSRREALLKFYSDNSLDYFGNTSIFNKKYGPSVHSYHNMETIFINAGYKVDAYNYSEQGTRKVRTWFFSK